MPNKLYLFTADFPYGTGETFLETEIEYLAKGFDKVHIVSANCVDSQTRELPENCSVERLNLHVSSFDKLRSLFGLFSPLFWKELRIIRRTYALPITFGILKTMLISSLRAKWVSKKVDQLVHAQSPGDNLFFYSYWCDDVALGLAMSQKKYPKISTVSRIHGWDVYFEASSLNYLPYRHFIAQNLKGIYAISRKGISYCRDVWKIKDLNKLHLARLGVVSQKQIEANKNGFLLVSCSNVIPLKRVELIVRALSNMKNTPMKWVHFGDGPLLEEIQGLAQEILPPVIQVEFKGRVPNQEVLKWYAKHKPNLFINVSSTEGIPVSIMEAMSFGIPVMATDVGGTSEIVNGRNGVLLPPNLNEQGLADALIAMIDDKERLTSKSDTAFKMWQENFNAEKNYDSFVKSLFQLS